MESADGLSGLAVGGAQGRAVLVDAVSAYRAALGQRLLATYALGSLAHGGFSPLVSDVDLGLVLADPLRSSDSQTVRRVADAVKARGSALHQRLSVFWGTPSTLRGGQGGGRFPPLDLLDLIEHGVLLGGADAREGLPRPGLADLVVAGAEFALDFLAGIGAAAHSGHGVGSMPHADRDAVDQIRQPAALLARGVRHVTKLVLFPVRFLYTADTGLVGTNQTAAEYYLAAAEPPGASLVAAALLWRASTSLDHATATALLHGQMIPLYLHYIDDHTARLTSLNRLELADAFEEWRTRILA